MSKGLKRSSISPPCMSPPITRKPTVSCGICRVRHLIVDSPILSQGIDPEPAKRNNDTYEHQITPTQNPEDR